MTAESVGDSRPKHVNKQLRKANKPLMEKRRRARINRCLDALRLIVDNSNDGRNNKLEKADILEKTLLFIQNNKSSSYHSTGSHRCFGDGYQECMKSVLKFFQNYSSTLDQSASTELLEFLKQRWESANVNPSLSHNEKSKENDSTQLSTNVPAPTVKRHEQISQFAEADNKNEINESSHLSSNEIPLPLRNRRYYEEYTAAKTVLTRLPIMVKPKIFRFDETVLKNEPLDLCKYSSHHPTDDLNGVWRPW